LQKPATIVFAELEKIEEFSIENPEERLASFLLYASEALLSPCPFLPDFLGLLDNEAKWKEAIISSDDPYMRYFQPLSSLHHWNPLVTHAYQGFS
jgi:hypothetical protein